MLEWEKLLNGDRERGSRSVPDHRTEFDKDYDRIISSSSLRRLQDKAQVFPLQRNDFTRTRLTHSYEVSGIGRSLGNNIAIWLVNEHKIDETLARQIPTALAVSCLVHDIGNPPFGHSGEDVIRKWFRTFFNTGEYLKLVHSATEQRIQTLTRAERLDFEYFEGNAQALRVIMRLQSLDDRHGINFSYGSLASLIKYPYTSDKLVSNSELKKFGIFQSESELFQDICSHTGIDGCRHPLVYLMEAADDIAYSAVDIEDGVKKGVVPWREVFKTVKNELPRYATDLAELEDREQDARAHGVPDADDVAALNFRIWAQGIMIKAALESFKQNYEAIMQGNGPTELLLNSSAADLLKLLKNIAREYVYNANEVLKLEIAGDQAISGLLNWFVPAVVSDIMEDIDKKHDKVYELISKNFRYVNLLSHSGTSEDKIDVKRRPRSLYSRFQLVTDFISGMTDSYAVDLFQQLSAIRQY